MRLRHKVTGVLLDTTEQVADHMGPAYERVEDEKSSSKPAAKSRTPKQDSKQDDK